MTNKDPYTNPFIAAHIKRCSLCRMHDLMVARGSQYGSVAQLDRYADHVRSVIARIKLAIEDAELQASHDLT